MSREPGGDQRSEKIRHGISACCYHGFHAVCSGRGLCNDPSTKGPETATFRFAGLQARQICTCQCHTNKKESTP